MTEPQVPQDRPLSFEAALARAEQIVRELEDSQLGLDDALSRYEEGVKLIRRCHDLLSGAQRRIDLLTGVDAQGRPISEPFADESDDSLEEKGARRSRRRSSASPRPTDIDEPSEGK